MNRSTVRCVVVSCSLIAIGMLALLLVPACGTIEGAGKDIQTLGKGTSNAAKATGEAISGER